MSLIYGFVANAYKTSKVYTILPNDGVADFTFSRAGTADRIDPDGNVETMAANVPRIDYANGGCPELLLDTGELCNGSQATFNDSEGVFQTSIRALSDDLSFRSLGVNDTTATNRILVRYNTSSNSIELNIFSAGVPEASISYEVEDITNEHFIECVWNGTYAELRVDGVIVGFTNTSNAPIGLSDCSFDTGVAGSEPFKGRCNEINVYDSSTDIKTFESPTELMQFANYEIIE